MTVLPAIRVPVVDARYTLPDDLLFRDFLKLEGDLQPDSWELLVAVPSSDAIIGAMLALRPRALLLLNTGTVAMTWWPILHAWHHARRRVQTRFPPPPIDPAVILTEHTLIPALDGMLGSVDRRRVAYLTTSGLSVHTALLGDYARATGGAVLHVGMDYDAQGKPDFSGPRYPRWIELDPTVAERRVLQQARALLRGGSPSEAVACLQQFAQRHRSELLDATQRWARACELRAALRFNDAWNEMKAALACCRRASNARDGRWTALAHCITHSLEAIQPLRGKKDPLRLLHLAAEARCLSQQEERAGRLNHAALLTYRAAEAAVVYRLAQRWRVGVDHGWQGEPLAGLEADFDALYQRCFRRPGGFRTVQQRAIGLFSGILLLTALGDPLVPGQGDADALHHFLDAFKHASTNRNRNILAHGFDSMTRESLAVWTAVVAGSPGSPGILHLLEAGEPQGAWAKALAAHAMLHLSDDGTTWSLT